MGCHCAPIFEVDILASFSITPKEVSIDFINFLTDLLGQKGALHDVGGYGGSDGVDKSNITAYYKLRIGSNRRLNQN